MNREVITETVSDNDLVRRIVSGEARLYAELMRRHNQRAYRVARAIVRNDDDAEDVVQQAFVHAYHRLALFRGEASFSTWITRIVINTALGGLRRASRHPSVTLLENEGAFDMADSADTPEQATYQREVGKLLESHVNRLPANLRVVFVMRDVEELSTEQTAELLGLSPEAVRVRLHRARKLLEEALSQVMTETQGVYHFAGERCSRIVRNVLSQLGINE